MPDDALPSRRIFSETTMDTHQGKILQSLEDARAFLDEHADTLASVVTTGAR